jgi:hypothetical protein
MGAMLSFWAGRLLFCVSIHDADTEEVVLSLFMKLPLMETSVGLCCIPLKSHALAVTYDMKLALRGDLMLLSCIHGDSYGMRRRVRGI